MNNNRVIDLVYEMLDEMSTSELQDYGYIELIGEWLSIIDDINPANTENWEQLLPMRRKRLAKFLEKDPQKSSKKTPKQAPSANYDYIEPSHYRKGGKETIDKMIEIYGVEDTAKWCEMTAFKYFDRAGEKPGEPLEREIEKIKWYKKKAKELRYGKDS